MAKLFLILLVFPVLSFATEVSITMDDFNIREEFLFPASKRNLSILQTLEKHQVKAALFVVGRHIKSDADKALLRAWGMEGHIIGNHTFSHNRFDEKVSAVEEINDIIKAEEVLKDFPNFKKIFRYPMLAEGDTVEKRDQVRQWLKHQGYAFGAVTIDTSDWYIDQRMREKLKTKPGFDVKQYRSYYLNHVWEKAVFYNDLSKKVLGREVKHTLLVHYNLLNALFLHDVIAMFKQRGWKVIDAEKAFEDPIYTKLPNSMPSGQSLIWGLAREAGKYEKDLRYPGEDSQYEKAALDAKGL